MTDREILEIEDRLASGLDAPQALLKTRSQKAALNSLLNIPVRQSRLSGPN